MPQGDMRQLRRLRRGWVRVISALALLYGTGGATAVAARHPSGDAAAIVSHFSGDTAAFASHFSGDAAAFVSHFGNASSGPCAAGATTLCIDDQPGDSRFEVSVHYQTAQGGGLSGEGHAIDLASLGVTHGGLFWFFSPDNPEMLIKVVNACGLDQKFWVFSAAGTNVGLTTTVRDTKTGAVKIYRNDDLTAAVPVQDTSAFGCSASSISPSAVEVLDARNEFERLAAAMPRGTDGGPEPGLGPPVMEGVPSATVAATAGGCVTDAFTLCVSDQPGDRRFRVRVHYKTTQGGLSGDGHAVPLATLGVTQGGLFWFFTPDNPEMLIKVLDGCGLDQMFWVFFSATTNVGLTVTVTDTQTGGSVVYQNPDLTAAAPVLDTSALSCSPGTPGRMAFVGRQTTVNQIYLMDVGASGVGTHPTRLTSDQEPENYPSWSPDGKRLVYQRDFNGSAIYVIDANGTGQRRLSPTPGFDVTPSWSPDGTRIVYARLHQAPQPDNPPMTDIRVMNVDGTDDHAVLANTLFSVEPRWSVHDQIVFMSLMNGSDLDIYVMNADGTGVVRLTAATNGNNGDPVWSSDGSRITFGSDREGGNRLNVFVMNADGSDQEPLTHFDMPYEAGDTNWSSDGKKIAFEWDINGMKQSDPNAYAEVWTMNPDGSGATSTGIPCSGVGCAPRWQPK